MDVGHFFEIWVIGLAVASLRAATPLTLAALGGLFSERCGVINIALEGMMIAGAFFAIFGADKFGHWTLGLVVAMIAGGLFALLHAVASIHLRADQIISGTAIILLAGGLVNYLNLSIYGAEGTPTDISRVPEIGSIVPLKYVGDMSIMVPMMILIVFATGFVVFRTRFGLHLRAVGEHPRAADTVGIDVYRVRYAAVVMSGVLAGLAGAYLSLANVGNYSEGITGGQGFIALAALIFGKWKPVPALLAALLFGFAQAFGNVLQTQGLPILGVGAGDIPTEIVTMFPYLITIVALAGFVGKSIPPAAIGKPYTKG